MGLFSIVREEEEKSLDQGLVDLLCKGYEYFIDYEKDENSVLKEIFSEKYHLNGEVNESIKNLLKYQKERDFEINSGLYLSKLISLSDEKIFNLDVIPLNKKKIYPHFLGLRLENKSLRIFGSSGNGLGFLSKKSYIVEEENTGHSLGENSDGSTYTIKGSAQTYIGQGATNSRIFLLKKYKELAKNIGSNTEIYQKKGNRMEKIYG